MNYEITLEGVTRTVSVRADGDGWLIAVDDGPTQRVAGRHTGTRWALDLAGQRQVVHVALRGDHAFVLDHGHALQGTVIDPRAAALSGHGGAGEGRIVTQMPGAIVRVPVAVGDVVEAGDVVVVVEAMKMENEFKAPFDGTVSEVLVTPGTTVDSGAALVVITPNEAT